jgi:hypothetical protein
MIYSIIYLSVLIGFTLLEYREYEKKNVLVVIKFMLLIGFFVVMVMHFRVAG